MGKRKEKKLGRRAEGESPSPGLRTGERALAGAGLPLRLAVGALFTVLVFAAFSYNLWPYAYIMVAVVSAFIVSHLLGSWKGSAATTILFTVAGSLLFSSGPPVSNEIYSPDMVMRHLIGLRQSQMLSYTPPVLLGVLGGFLGWGMGALSVRSAKWTRRITYGFLVLFLVNFVGISMDLNPASVQSSLREPLAGKYNNFNSMNIKTFYYMKGGMDFYTAYSTAYSQKADTPGAPPRSLWEWRLPTVFHLWKLLLPPNGFYILYLYLLFSVCTLYFVFDISSRYLAHPFSLVPVILSAYPFIYGLAGFWFTFPEFWGAFFLMAGLWGYSRKNDAAAVAGLSLSLAIRQFFVIPWLAVISMLAWKREWKRLALFMIPLLAMGVVSLLHWHGVNAVDYPENPPLGEWLQGSPGKLWSAFIFGSVLLSGGGAIKILLLLLFLGGTYLYRRDSFVLTVAASALLPMLLFLKLGPGSERAYWGMVFLPQLLFVAGISLAPLLKELTPAVELPSPVKETSEGKDN
jgi:hypothetical protein